MAKKILRMFLFALGGLLALTVAVAAGLYGYAALDKEDRFYIVDSEPVDADYLLKPGPADAEGEHAHFGHAVHHLKQGKGLMLGYRFYSNGDVMIIDDEDFRKISIWLPGGAPQASVQLDLADRAQVWVALSQGGSAWPARACSGYVSSGSLRLDRDGPRYRVSLHGQFAPQGNGALSRCQPVPVDIAFVATELRFSQLTPWLGSAGGHPYAETYR